MDSLLGRLHKAMSTQAYLANSVAILSLPVSPGTGAGRFWGPQ